MEISHILEGWRNHLFPPAKLKNFIKETSDSRLGICEPCDFNSSQGKIKGSSYCKNCGCPLIQKSKSLKSSCPIGRWAAVATEDQEHEINLAIKNGEKNSQ